MAKIKEKAKQEAPRVDLIAMIRSKEDAKGGPLTADVHPSEVENWKKTGWKEKQKGDFS